MTISFLFDSLAMFIYYVNTSYALTKNMNKNEPWISEIKQILALSKQYENMKITQVSFIFGWIFNWRFVMLSMYFKTDVWTTFH